MTRRVAIVGAGVAGLTAARRLRAAGVEVDVVDKGRSVGGRLATRRIGDGRADHGAQFFTVRSVSFERLIDQFIEDGLVRVWTRGFGDEPDGHARYVVEGGMNRLAKRLATELPPASLHLEHRVTSLDDELLAGTDRVLLTSPVPQTIELLDASSHDVPDDLREIRYAPTICLLARLDRAATGLPAAGARQRPEGAPVEFVADNSTKGISDEPILTMHLTGDASSARYELDDDAILPELTELAKPFVGDAVLVETQVKRWRYATPTVLHPDPVLVDDRLVFAGDAFGEARVEGAFLSGLAAAEAIIAG